MITLHLGSRAEKSLTEAQIRLLNLSKNPKPLAAAASATGGFGQNTR